MWSRGLPASLLLFATFTLLSPVAAGGVLAARKPAPVPMAVQRVAARGSSFVVLLQAAGGKVVVPIWIGQREAQAIQMGLSGVRAPRPLTHDLLRAVIERLGARIHRVQVVAIRDNVFIGQLTLKDPSGKRIDVDARPSDLIALAVAERLPIFVAPEVIDRTGVRSVPPAPGAVPGGVLGPGI